MRKGLKSLCENPDALSGHGFNRAVSALQSIRLQPLRFAFCGSKSELRVLTQTLKHPPLQRRCAGIWARFYVVPGPAKARALRTFFSRDVRRAIAGRAKPALPYELSDGLSGHGFNRAVSDQNSVRLQPLRSVVLTITSPPRLM